VDFLKLDVEGAELEVLRGAWRLLDSKHRPVILAEVCDIRTAPWGYRARDIVDFLNRLGYLWFSLVADGTAEPIQPGLACFDGNLVAAPSERLDGFPLRVSVKTVSGHG
jgi:hypothetical protein